MKRYFLVLVILMVTGTTFAQSLTLKKGAIIDSLRVNDSIPETFALYLPKSFETTKSWPVVFVAEMQGKAKQAISMMASAAESQGYILAASNNVNDSLSITKNILVSSRMFQKLLSIIPVHKDQFYVAGFSGGGRFASLLPTFIKNINGVFSAGAAVSNIDVLSTKNPFHFIGIVGKEDFNYPVMLASEKQLQQMKFPNQLLVFDGGAQWPPQAYTEMALQSFTLVAMAKGRIPKDEAYIEKAYKDQLVITNTMLNANQPISAYNQIQELIAIFRPLRSTDSLASSAKVLRKSKLYRSQKRLESTAMYKEALKKEDYTYYLEDDILTYNYNNLGWWKYQLDELQEYTEKGNVFEQKMAKRLEGYLNALIEDNLDNLYQAEMVDLEAVNLLHMLKTLTFPKEPDNYLKVIEHSAFVEDSGTALFYLEELLKTGYSDKEKLYTIPNTALLRISPEYNKLVEKYLKSARYEPID